MKVLVEAAEAESPAEARATPHERRVEAGAPGL
jgi:hypothetical protein